LSKYKQKKDKNESVVNPNFREKNEKKWGYLRIKLK
jgi:hypothetical protein